MGRNRSHKKRGWPDNLYESRGYYSWKNPTTGQWFGLGRDFAKAKQQAAEANIHISGMAEQTRLVDRLTGDVDRTIGALLVRYVESLAERNLAPNTLRTKRCHIKAVEDRWEERTAASISTLDVDELLQEYIKDEKARMAQAVRSFLIELFDMGIAIGWLEKNVARVTRSPKVEVKRARLTMEAFLAIYDIAITNDEPWVARSMELALISSQRREDVAAMEFRWREKGEKQEESTSWLDGDTLWVIQQKTGNRVAIPLSLRMTLQVGERPIDWKLGDIVRRCRDNVISPWLVHHSRKRNLSKPGDQVWIDTVTKGFARCRDKTELAWPEGKEPPSFHEIRSLAIRIWTDLRGSEFAQALAGHKDPATTAVYQDARGEWVMVKAG